MRKASYAVLPILLAIVILVTVSDAATAQDWRGQGRVTGSVTSTDGNPIAGCQIKLTHQQYQDGPTVETDDRGRWVANGLRGGMWNIDFLHPDYQPYGISVEVSNVRRGKPIEVVLEPAQAVVGGLSEELAAEVTAAEELFSAGSYQEALDAFSTLSEAHPEALAIKVRVAECQMELGNMEGAKGICNEILATDPENLGAVGVLANVAFKEEDWQTSANYYEQIVERMPSDAGSWGNLGLLYTNLQQYDKAQNAYSKAIELNPEYYDLYVQLAAIAMVAEDYAAALETLEKLKELAPADHPVFQVWNVEELIALCKAELGQ